MAENNEIPENADKILFAEDLMNHVLGYKINTEYSTITAERYRGIVHNAFNETMKEAVKFLYYKVIIQHMEVFFGMLGENSVNLSTYISYIETMKKKYLTSDFNPGSFLHFCVSLAGGAGYVYNIGVPEAPSIAVTHMVEALNNVDVSGGGWITLNTAGEKFANIKYKSRK